MIEFSRYRENPLAPTVIVNKVGGIYQVNSTLIKVTFVAQFPLAGGEVDPVATVHLIWPTRQWLESGDIFRFAMAEFQRGMIHDDGGGRRARTQ